VTALMAAADDVERLAQHCVRLQNDSALARQLSRNARDLIRQYHWDRALGRLEREFLGDDGPELVIATLEHQESAAAERGSQIDDRGSKPQPESSSLVCSPLDPRSLARDPWEVSQP